MNKKNETTTQNGSLDFILVNCKFKLARAQKLYSSAVIFDFYGRMRIRAWAATTRRNMVRG